MDTPVRRSAERYAPAERDELLPGVLDSVPGSPQLADEQSPPKEPAAVVQKEKAGQVLVGSSSHQREAQLLPLLCSTQELVSAAYMQEGPEPGPEREMLQPKHSAPTAASAAAARHNDQEEKEEKEEKEERSKVEHGLLVGLWKAQRQQLEMILGRGHMATSVILLVPQTLCAAVIVAADSWVTTAVAGGLIACYSCAQISKMVKRRLDHARWDKELALFVAIWLYISMLTTVPALLFASADEDAADGGASRGAAGVGCFILARWTLGWIFMWYRAPRIPPVQPEQHLLSMPPSLLLRL
jgi:hypothetical protein